jgi:hypothetical protein
MDQFRTFRPGDRVRISDQYWHREVAGCRGTVGTLPEGVEPAADCLWIELDVDEWKVGVIDGCQVSVEALQPL